MLIKYFKSKPNINRKQICMYLQCLKNKFIALHTFAHKQLPLKSLKSISLNM